VHRAANGQPFLADRVPAIVALASDTPPPAGYDVPAASLDDVPAVADLALAHAAPLADVLRLLRGLPAPARVPNRAAR
jgi:hypothetical protein